MYCDSLAATAIQITSHQVDPTSLDDPAARMQYPGSNNSLPELRIIQHAVGNEISGALRFTHSFGLVPNGHSAGTRSVWQKTALSQTSFLGIAGLLPSTWVLYGYIIDSNTPNVGGYKNTGKDLEMSTPS